MHAGAVGVCFPVYSTQGSLSCARNLLSLLNKNKKKGQWDNGDLSKAYADLLPTVILRVQHIRVFYTSFAMQMVNNRSSPT